MTTDRNGDAVAWRQAVADGLGFLIPETGQIADPETILSHVRDYKDQAEYAWTLLNRIATFHPRGVTSYPSGEGMVTEEEDVIKDGCQMCQVPWPCQTMAVIEESDSSLRYHI